MDELLGKFTVRTEKSVISAPKPLNFKITEFLGVELFKKIPLNQEDRCLVGKDLKVGNVVFIPGLVSGWLEMVVISKDGVLHLENNNLYGTLEFDKDDRHCWICTGLINRKCSESL